MSAATRFELLLVVLFSGVVAVAAGLGALPAALPIGELVMVAAGLLLAQGLLRDLHKRFVARRCSTQAAGSCMCAESPLGITAIAAGVILLLSGVRVAVSMPWPAWPVLVFCAGLAGLVLKDIVIDWKARRIRRAMH